MDLKKEMNDVPERNEFDVQKELVEKRKDIHSIEELAAYLKDIEENYNCGYGVAPRAIAQGALAVAWYLADKMGITGFQAGCVMWDFVRDWSYPGNECGLKMVNYDDMLYPQYDHKFAKTIPSYTWRALQKKAKENLKEVRGAHPNVIAHWESIVRGEVPFGYSVT